MPTSVLDFRQSGGGLNRDSSAFTLTNNEWSDMNNVRIHNRAVSKIAGEATLYSSAFASGLSPVHSQFIRGAGTNQFYYFIDGLGDTHRVNAAGSVARVTRGLSNTNRLTTGVQYQMNPVNGGYVLLVNDGNRTPEYITSVGSGTNSTQLTQIPGWNYGSTYSNVRAGVIRPFKYVLVAGNITQTVTATNAIQQNAGTIRVSNQAAPGGLPTWDPSLAAADTADEFELSENGRIIDMISYGDTLAVFTEDNIFGLTLTGNSTVPVRVSKQLQGRGMLATGCGVEFFGKIFVVGNEDIYTFQGGANSRSVADSRVRDYFFDNVNATHYENTFVVHNERYDEIWVCFPNGDSSGPCNEALIWNYAENNWTRRDLPNVRQGSLGPTITSSAFVFSDYRLQLPDNTTRRIKTMDEGTTFDGTAFTAFAEKRGIDVAGQMGSAGEIQEAYILATGTGDCTVSFQSTDTPGASIDLTSTTDRNVSRETFDLDGSDSQLKLNPRTNGRFAHFRIEGSNDWNLHALTLETKDTDKRSR